MFDWFGVVVVIDYQGRYCFFYIGYLLGLNLGLLGICIDVMLYILVCCRIIEIIYVLDKNGKYLFYLLEEKYGIRELWSLSFDVNFCYFWVGVFFIENIIEYNNF